MSSPGSLLIYGATGYTGRLMAHLACERGLRPVLGGRNEARVGELAASLGLDYRVASLDEGLDVALRDMRVVIHAAGPFSTTSRPMLEACLRTGTHYLDVSGELMAIDAVRAYDARARQRGVMLMPGAGFDVVPSDCLAVHLARQVRAPRRLALGISGLDLMSRGSFKTLIETAAHGVRIRRGGVLTEVAPGELQRVFDYGDGPRPSFAMSWADVCTAYYSTGIGDIEVYYDANPLLRMNLAASRLFGGELVMAMGRAWFQALADVLPEGPSEAQRAGRRAIVVGEVEDDTGRRVRARLCTPEAYGFTCVTALGIAERVLAGDLDTGFQTPARIYGPDFVLAFPGVVREDF